MALQKTAIPINFSRGLDKKTDPFQVQVGNFLSLTNSVFTTTGRLTKRNGFANITDLPNTDQTTLTTLNDNLIATGSNLYAYSNIAQEWINKGQVQPVRLNVQSMIRNSDSQVSPDSATTANGLTVLVYKDSDGNSYYQISDANTGEQIVSRQELSPGAVSGRTFILGIYFIVTFIASIAGTPHLQYIAIPINNVTNPSPIVDFSTNVGDINSGYDGIVYASSLYLAWEGVGSVVNIATLTPGLISTSPVVIPASDADLMSVVSDIVNNRIYVSFWDSSGNNGYSASFDSVLNPIMTKTQIITATDISELTSIIMDDLLYVFYENVNVYAFPGGAESDFVSSVIVTPPATVGVGTVSAPVVVLRSVGLASKAFLLNGIIYLLVVYGDTDQSPSTDDSNESTYFLIDNTGAIIMRLAATNAGGYEASQVLPNVTNVLGTLYVPYIITDFLTTVNKGTNLPAGTPVNAIYTQTGINLAVFNITNSNQQSSEIADALHLTGGQLWEYDGVKPVEHGFHIYPENIVAVITAGGTLTNQQYFYAFTYEWTDNQGMLHRSAPSIPLPFNPGAASQQATIYVPTLRLTDKIAPNPVRIVGYRWSTAQQIYYQFTSVTSPVLNDTSVDYVTIIDTASDASILGNTILYTTGGVLENIAAPPSSDSALFNNRLWLIDAEDPNLLWFSKQVIENVPVEMSDLLTLFVAPTTGSQGSTGPMKCISAMDDKLIIFKPNAIYYVNGIGPDNTGANSGYSDAIFITATVGSSNPNSIVLIPNGIMFQSDKGIWLLGRDLSTQYIGAPVESFNSNTVMSAEAIPGTNEVRFVLDNGVTLMYDYYFDQWATHTNIKAISATLYQGRHTYLNSLAKVFQEAPGTYTDGSVPVLISFTTSWINLAGLQGFERFYFGFLLGMYYSPFKLNVGLAYDYNASYTHNIVITPDNATSNWGEEALWGSGGPWGGPGNVFRARLFPDKQKCESFQITVQEVYDSTLGVVPGQGLSLSGLNLIAGVKRGFRTQRASKSFG